jgi:hypothetical protein
MLRFELTITGQDTVTHALREAAAVLPRQVVNTTYDWAELHVMRYLSVRPYPPERPGQRYKRTGRLGRSWKVSTRGQSVVIENTAPIPATWSVTARAIVRRGRTAADGGLCATW